MSSSLSTNAYYNRANINRLNVNNLKVSNLNVVVSESYNNIELLYSLVAENSTFENNILTLNSENLSIIVFTDRPHRVAGYIPAYNLTKLKEYWNRMTKPQSFQKDEPNIVLVHNNIQSTYVIKEILDFDANDSIKVRLEILTETFEGTFPQIPVNDFVNDTCNVFIDNAEEILQIISIALDAIEVILCLAPIPGARIADEALIDVRTELIASQEEQAVAKAADEAASTPATRKALEEADENLGKVSNKAISKINNSKQITINHQKIKSGENTVETASKVVNVSEGAVTAYNHLTDKKNNI